MSPMKRAVLGIGIIAALVVLGVMYGPRYNDSNTTTGDVVPATVTVTNELGSLNINRSLVYQGVAITITRVAQAHSFSDDGKSAYAHVNEIVRVYVHVQAPSNQSGPVGIDYSTLATLVKPDGTQLKARLLQISPDILPGQRQDGFFDFWVNAPLQLSTLTFRLNGNMIAFG